mmetsp:Transcript_9155/g.20961  ORF Transcript_9155/g.20961 Transcript_9155/m.20961 type:complete len:277 (-) Transcript_9155:1023-1853(-)
MRPMRVARNSKRLFDLIGYVSEHTKSTIASEKATRFLALSSDVISTSALCRSKYLQTHDRSSPPNSRSSESGTPSGTHSSTVDSTVVPVGDCQTHPSTTRHSNWKTIWTVTCLNLALSLVQNPMFETEGTRTSVFSSVMFPTGREKPDTSSSTSAPTSSQSSSGSAVSCDADLALLNLSDGRIFFSMFLFDSRNPDRKSPPSRRIMRSVTLDTGPSGAGLPSAEMSSSVRKSSDIRPSSPSSVPITTRKWLDASYISNRICTVVTLVLVCSSANAA